jgi:hypothetical protein
VDWGAYEVFSVISGAVFLIGVFVPELSAKERLGNFAVGAGLVAYGIFVASRTSGMWLFPIWIFVIPFAGAIFGIVTVVQRIRGSMVAEKEPVVWAPATSSRTETRFSSGPPDGRVALTVSVAAASQRRVVPAASHAPSAICPSCGTPFEEDAGFCAICGTAAQSRVAEPETTEHKTAATVPGARSGGSAFCPTCDVPFEEESCFCGICGTARDSGAGANRSTAEGRAVTHHPREDW